MSKNYKVGIVGYGVVGKGIHKLLKEDVKAVYDPYVSDEAVLEEVINIGLGGEAMPSREKSDFEDLELIVVCVMTKEGEDGSCDTSIVEESIAWVHNLNPDAVILVKSAIVPSQVSSIYGKYLNLKLVVSPEYMGESKYFTPFWKYPDPKDMEGHTWQVFGGQKENTSFCVDVFKRRMSVDCKHIQTDLMTAALCKYMENCFFALKVTFCNEFYDIAEAYGIDYNELRTCWLADTRINPNHTLVFPKDRGYGGKCFPKDVKAICRDVEDFATYDPKLMRAVDEVNSYLRDNE